MINLIVEGHKLDLYPVNLSYKRTNNAFTFGKLTLNRTQSFKMPKTAKNMQVLGLGSALVFGEGERRYFNAQLQGSGFVESGLLYIDSVEKEFTCIFIFGNLLVLKEIANIKNMADVLGEYDIYINYIPASRLGKYANEDNLGLYEIVEYRNPYPSNYGYYNYIMPSISVRGLINCANEIYGQTFDLSAIKDYRIIQSTTKSPSRENVIFAKTALNVTSAEENLQKLFIFASGTYNIYSDTGNVGSYETVPMIHYETLRDTEIKMPLDFPDDIFILQNKSRYNNDTGKVDINIVFWGGYEFEIDEREVRSLSEEGTRRTIGEPLAGRTITIPRGGQFSFYRKTDFHNTRGAGGSSQNNYRGFFTGDASPFEYIMPTISLKENGELTTGTPYISYLLDNLPKMSFVDLYNSVAILEGKYMTFIDGQVTAVEYDSINELKHIKNVISHSNLKREGVTSAQNNYIRFEETETVKPANKIEYNYPTNNALLEEEAIIYKIPYSEGEEYTDNNDIYLENIVTGKTDEVTGRTELKILSDVPTIAIAGEGQFLKRVTMSPIDLLLQIYTNSTQIEITVYMSLYEYMTIKETNILIYNHSKWVWLSATWQNNKAKFVLQKI